MVRKVGIAGGVCAEVEVGALDGAPLPGKVWCCGNGGGVAAEVKEADTEAEASEADEVGKS